MAEFAKEIPKNSKNIDRILNFLKENYGNTIVEVGEEKFCLPRPYVNYEDAIRNFEVKDDDIFVVSHPKTGTTWCQEMVWLIANNFDYEDAKAKFILERVPIFESLAYVDPLTDRYQKWKDFHPLARPESFPSPRCFKSHLPWSLLPAQIQNGTKTPKIISIVRNAHDTCVSSYHHWQTIGYKLKFEDFCELFLAGKTMLGPFWKSILSIWQQRHRPNVLVLHFKDMKEDLPSAIRKVADFLDKPISDDQVAKLADYLSFESMKVNPAVQYIQNFVRKGEVGGFKSEMSPELIERFNKWEKENLEGTDLAFN